MPESHAEHAVHGAVFFAAHIVKALADLLDESFVVGGVAIGGESAGIFVPLREFE